MRRNNNHIVDRAEAGRFIGTGTDEERYDDNYNPTNHVGRRTDIRLTGAYDIKEPGVDGVMLPNNLNSKQYQAYVNSKAGPVKTYNIKDKEGAK